MLTPFLCRFFNKKYHFVIGKVNKLLYIKGKGENPMTNPETSFDKKTVLVGGTLYEIETGSGNENRYEIHSGFGGDYLVDTHDFWWNIWNAFFYGTISLFLGGVILLLFLGWLYS
jgi:hypothetical protein